MIDLGDGCDVVLVEAVCLSIPRMRMTRLFVVCDEVQIMLVTLFASHVHVTIHELDGLASQDE